MPKVTMQVLVACEFSGTVRDAFLARGHDAWGCDLCSGREPTHGRHVRGDVRPLLEERWDLVVAHPPCTYLTNAGVCWLRGGKDLERMKEMEKACRFFLECLNANSPRVCVENPIMHRYARKLVGVGCSQIIQPWQWGGSVSKSTCLWLRGLPPLEPLVKVKPESVRSCRTCKSDANSMREVLGLKGLRGHLRSVTYPEIAYAMAERWG